MCRWAGSVCRCHLVYLTFKTIQKVSSCTAVFRDNWHYINTNDTVGDIASFTGPGHCHTVGASHVFTSPSSRTLFQYHCLFSIMTMFKKRVIVLLRVDIRHQGVQVTPGSHRVSSAVCVFCAEVIPTYHRYVSLSKYALCLWSHSKKCLRIYWTTGFVSRKWRSMFGDYRLEMCLSVNQSVSFCVLCQMKI